MAFLRLPDRAPAALRAPVEVEIHETPAPKRDEPKVEVAPEVRAEPKPERLAMRIPSRESEPVTLQPKKRPEEEAAPHDATPRDLAKIDLNLKALPLGVGSFAVAPQATAPKSTGTGRRYDAGDPLLGKIPTEHEERFPLKPVKDGYVYSSSRFTAKITLDGQVSFSDKYVNFDGKNSGMAFDLSEIAMRAHHEDPNRHEKMRFMEATTQLRAKLTEETRRDNMQRSLSRLPQKLDEIWLCERPAKQRRQLLFTMWRDTLDVEAQSADGARDARLVIEDYVRRKLPAGSDDAFSDEELLAYNRGLKVPFRPYR